MVRFLVWSVGSHDPHTIPADRGLSQGRIAGPVPNTRVPESLLPLPTFVTQSTVHSAHRINARESQVERKVLSPQYDVSLLVLIEGTNQTGRPPHRAAQDRLQIMEETGSAIGKGVGAQAPQGEGTNMPEPAPDRRLDREQDVSAGQVDGLVRRASVGHVISARAPMWAVDIA